MKLSARNTLEASRRHRQRKVTAIVRIDVGGGNVITSSITMASLKDLGLKKGAPVVAIIKASEVILGVED
jgi:molybdopterin-binding protein